MTKTTILVASMVLMLEVTHGLNFFNEIFKELGVEDLLKGKTPKKGFLSSSDSVPNSKIEDLTNGLSGEIRRTGESCFTRNTADQNLTFVKPADVERQLIKCDETWLRYRLRRYTKDGESCITKMRTNDDVWSDEYQYRQIYLAKDDSGKDIAVPEIVCSNKTAKRKTNEKLLNIRKQVCIDLRRKVESRCDSCQLAAMSMEPFKTHVIKCTDATLPGTFRYARSPLQYCSCFEAHDNAAFPLAKCLKQQKDSSKRPTKNLIDLLRNAAPDTISEDQRRDLAFLGACMSSNFGSGRSCLTRNDQGKRSTVDPAALRRKLVECERNTLRYRIDKETGCVMHFPGTSNVWYNAQHYHLEVNPKYHSNGKKVLNERFSCGKEDADDKKRSLNVMKSMCVQMRNQLQSRCDVCKLKVLVDVTSSKKIEECVLDRLEKPASDPRDALEDCIRKAATLENERLC